MLQNTRKWNALFKIFSFVIQFLLSSLFNYCFVKKKNDFTRLHKCIKFQNQAMIQKFLLLSQHNFLQNDSYIKIIN